MTSEPDSTPRRRPLTIDLTAREVETEKPASTGEGAAADLPGDRTEEAEAVGGRSRRNFAEVIARLKTLATGAHAKGAAAGAIVGALAMLAILSGLWIAGFSRSQNGITPPSLQVQKTPAVEGISARLDKIEATLAAQRPDAALATRTAAAKAEAKSLGDSLAALNRRLDDVAVTARAALAHADAASVVADASKSAARQSGVQPSDLDPLANRIAALERAVKALSDVAARRPASVDDRAARLSIAAEALRAAAERGVPYEAELAAVKSFGADPNALAPLEPFASAGIPGAGALTRELATLTPTLLRAAGAASGEGSFLGRLQANAEKLVRISPIDAPQGDDPAATIARINIAAARGDIAAARADVVRLPDATRSLAETWLKKAEAREAAITASRRLAADALVALSRPAQQ